MLLLLATLPGFSASPETPTLASPLDGEAAVASPVTLSVSASDTDGDALTATFYGRVRAARGEDFTIIALPDTQHYACGCAGGSTETFGLQTSWVVEQVGALNIAYVAQLGDCVENGDDAPDEWIIADAAFAYFEEDRSPYALPAGGLPYGIAVGNHDQTPMGDPEGTTLYYNLYFGSDRFASAAWYGGHYGDNNDNHYDLFEAGGQGFIAIYFEYDSVPDAEVLAWADGLLSTYADRHAIVVSHYLLNSSGEFSTQGRETYEALSSHRNLFLMLAGHVSAEAQRTDLGVGTVHTLLSDYQSRSGGGDGWLRVLQLSPEAGTIAVSTYSPTLDSTEDDEDSVFTLDWDPDLSDWQELGTVEVVDGTASVAWEGLDPELTYEWKVTVTDGTDSVGAGPWTFTTAAAVVVDTGGDSGGGETAAHTGESGGVDSVGEGEGDGEGEGEQETAPPKVEPAACGCASSRAGGWAWLAGLAGVLAGRRRIRRDTTARSPTPD